MKGIFTNALSLALILSVASTSVFASESKALQIPQDIRIINVEFVDSSPASSATKTPAPADTSIAPLLGNVVECVGRGASNLIKSVKHNSC